MVLDDMPRGKPCPTCASRVKGEKEAESRADSTPDSNVKGVDVVKRQAERARKLCPCEGECAT